MLLFPSLYVTYLVNICVCFFVGGGGGCACLCWWQDKARLKARERRASNAVLLTGTCVCVCVWYLVFMAVHIVIMCTAVYTNLYLLCIYVSIFLSIYLCHVWCSYMYKFILLSIYRSIDWSIYTVCVCVSVCAGEQRSLVFNSAQRMYSLQNVFWQYEWRCARLESYVIKVTSNLMASHTHVQL